jgi:cytidylate kinase
MDCSVVAISRTLGAGGEDLGHLLAADLGFRYVDAEIITTAAQQAGVSRETLEKTEARKPLLSRILENIAKAGPPIMYGPAEFAVAAAGDAAGQASYEALITDVIHETASEGKVVLVAHGASIPLAGLPGLVRVLVTASPKVRAQRVALERGMTADKAASAIADSDRARAEYFKRFYGVDHELPTHYDIVLNTDVAGIKAGQQAILALIRT